ncbi:MAG TPA: hypothetical protein VFU46_05380 [Gemmatimonadales bacterium]|nr:hypothetical protein [Gemmatimonadales bacterium]
MLVGLWGLATGRDGLAGDRSAWGASVSYPNDPWQASASYRRIGDGFDPSLGFVPRRAVEIVTGGGELRLGTPLPGVRDAVFQLHGRLVRDSLRRRESYVVFSAPFYLAFESGAGLEFNVVPYGERLVEPFPIAPDVTIPPGSYDWIRYRLEGTLASKRKVSGRLTWWFGDFYDGRLTELSGALVPRPTAAIALELTAVRNTGSLPGGRVSQDLVGARVQVNLWANLTFNSLVQYDNQSRILGANSRLRWQFHPLGELFVVYNRNREREAGRWRFASEQLLTKVQYAFRL